MIVEYRIDSRKRATYILYPLLKLLAAGVVGSIISLFVFEIRDQILIIVLVVWLWFALIHLLPFFSIAISHLRIHKNAVFYVDKSNKKFRYTDDKLDLKFEFDQLEKVICVVSPPKYGRRPDVLGFGHFFYWKLELKTGLTLQLSCLLADDEVHFGKPIAHEKRLFPRPSYKYRCAAVYL